MLDMTERKLSKAVDISTAIREREYEKRQIARTLLEIEAIQATISHLETKTKTGRLAVQNVSALISAATSILSQHV